MQNSSAVPVVFLIDDNLEFAYLIERYCAASGCKMQHFMTTAETLGHFQQSLPNVLLLNMMLTSGNSQRFIMALKHDKQLMHIPVIAFSSLRDENRAKSEGTDYFLLKPIMYNDFLTALQATGVLPQAA